MFREACDCYRFLSKIIEMKITFRRNMQIVHVKVILIVLSVENFTSFPEMLVDVKFYDCCVGALNLYILRESSF